MLLKKAMDKYHIWQQIQCVTFSSEDFLIQACTFFLAWLFNERHKEAMNVFSEINWWRRAKKSPYCKACSTVRKLADTWEKLFFHLQSMSMGIQRGSAVCAMACSATSKPQIPFSSHHTCWAPDVWTLKHSLFWRSSHNKVIDVLSFFFAKIFNKSAKLLIQLLVIWRKKSKKSRGYSKINIFKMSVHRSKEKFRLLALNNLKLRLLIWFNCASNTAQSLHRGQVMFLYRIVQCADLKSSSDMISVPSLIFISLEEITILSMMVITIII